MKGRQVWESLQNLVLLLPHLFQGLVTRDFARSGQFLVSWSPSINSVNDHTGFYLQSRSFDLYGFWGHCFQIQGGVNFGAQYAFLPLVVLWKLGVSGFLLIAISAYAGLFVTLYKVGSLAVSPLIWVLAGMVALCSPYFKNATFVGGRYDIPGWALLIIGLVFLLDRQFMWALVVLTLAFMSHPSVSIVATLFMGIFVAIGQVGEQGTLCFLGAQALNLFWYIPFIRIKKIENLAGHSWAVPLADKTRTRAVYMPKLLGMVIFVVTYVPFNRDPRGLTFCLLPLAVFIFNCWQDKFINRFSVELLWLASGAAAMAYADSPVQCIPYLMSLYIYAAPSPRFSFPFRPFLVPKHKICTTLEAVYKNMALNARMGFVTCPQDADQWRQDAKYQFMFQLGLLSKKRWIELFDIGPTGRDLKGAGNSRGRSPWERYLKSRVSRYGLDYVVSVADYRSRLDGVTWLSRMTEVSIPQLGSVPSNTYLLYKVTCPVLRASSGCKVEPLPTGELEVTHNGGRVAFNYKAFLGLKAVQGDKELLIYTDQNDNMLLDCPNDKPVRILRAPFRFWLPNRNIRKERKSVRFHGVEAGHGGTQET